MSEPKISADAKRTAAEHLADAWCREQARGRHGIFEFPSDERYRVIATERAENALARMASHGFSVVETERFDAACNILGLITDTYRGLVMDTDKDQALHAKVIENADKHIAKLREYLPTPTGGVA